ncbi:uncharacterized protein N7503_006491 [Penicillium pulvis]|uniref:uncharacterized protein n=1 Tax=Penicillium pulvis TaxID=1562058 RepID=UPI002547AAEA|nr:uncharacterized protein N7503_006491 [Penicillium pulvis]KAJ5798986.1 hypothetical protein N7503_006491 [Penicillium pulvis]
MPTTTDPHVLPGLEFKAYCEDRDFRAQGKPEPNSRSQTVIYRLHDKKWWIKITLEGAIPCSSCDVRPGQIKSKRERRNELQEFVTKIDFQSLALLNDTVTEIVLKGETKNLDSANLCLEPELIDQPTWLIGNMRYHIREDPLRVKYPSSVQFPSFRAVEISELIQEAEITNGVFRVFHKGDRTPYILKVVNRPFYHPRDTDVLQQELENLELFRGASGIVQAAGIAVFTNPYATCQEGSQQMVINGILLDFYCGGSLQQVLKEQCFNDISSESWAIQIGNALDTIHRVKKTHMDLKPSNIVLDKDGNAIIIDISGIGGVTHEWQAPEIRDEISPFDLPFQTRQLNDIWAYGKVLQEIASKVKDCSFRKTLSMVADHLTEDVTTRWTLSEAISQLRIRHHSD